MAHIPIVRVGGVLVATLQDDIDDDTAVALQGELSRRIVAERAHAALLDISALEFVDSFISRVLGDTAMVANILGARVAVVGMRPAVAITLVELGLTLQGVTTALTVDHGMRLLGTPPGPAGTTRAGPVGEGNGDRTHRRTR